jgi:hypothetical protein
MTKLAFVLSLLSITAFGCKQQFWTFIPQPENETVAVVDKPTEKPVEKPDEKPVEPPETPKQVILILGIDGMD